jgi:hypothetical protein
MASVAIRITLMVDPDPAFPFDADPESNFQIKAQILEGLKKCSNTLLFHTFWLVICKLMRIWIQIITLMRIRIQIITLMRIRIHNTEEG